MNPIFLNCFIQLFFRIGFIRRIRLSVMIAIHIINAVFGFDFARHSKNLLHAFIRCIFLYNIAAKHQKVRMLVLQIGKCLFYRILALNRIKVRICKQGNLIVSNFFYRCQRIVSLFYLCHVGKPINHNYDKNNDRQCTTAVNFMKNPIYSALFFAAQKKTQDKCHNVKKEE